MQQQHGRHIDWGCRIRRLHPSSVVDMTQTIWWWGSTPGALLNMEYPYIAITDQPVIVGWLVGWLVSQRINPFRVI